jgi:protein-tyrosine-phosphatase
MRSGEGMTKKILFVCVENAGRSQMAEAFAKHYGEGKILASSAGLKPPDKVSPVVVEAMREKGIDISMNRPKLLTMQMIEDADVAITMGCGVEEVCPAVLIDNVVDWELDDPKGQPIEKVREIRDEVERRVKALIHELTTKAGS